MIHDAFEREEEKLALESLLMREQNKSLRSQLQAAVELLRERTGEDPGPALAERVQRNSLRAALMTGGGQ